jgi:hypothetical protein
LKPDWNGDLKPGPLEIGFDHFFGNPGVNSSPPFAYVEDHRVVGLDAADPLVAGKPSVSRRKPTDPNCLISGSVVGKNIPRPGVELLLRWIRYESTTTKP